MTFEYSLKVRGYELDSFNHVNNAVYLNYMEQARWEIFRETGTVAYLTEHRILPAVIDSTIRYIREVTLFDEVLIKTRVTVDGNYLAFNHVAYNVGTGKKSCKSKTRLLFLTHDRQPIDIPEFILERMGC